MITTQPTAQNKAALIELLDQAPRRLASLAEGKDEPSLLLPLGEGQRSFRENLSHLLHSEARLVEAIGQILLLPSPDLPPIHPEREWGKLVRYQNLAINDLLSYFKLRRQILLGVLESLSEKDWLRVGQERGKKRRESVYWKVRTLALHEGDHLGQLEEMMGGREG